MTSDRLTVRSDKQLKHRLHKWGVKKYIPSTDMDIMHAIKRKRQAEGKDIRFQFHGHEVEQERIERAYKRRKGPLSSPRGKDLSLVTEFRLSEPVLQKSHPISDLRCRHIATLSFPHFLYRSSTSDLAMLHGCPVLVALVSMPTTRP